MDINVLLEEKIKKAERGRNFWILLKENYQLSEQDYVVIFPEKNTKCNEYILKYLDRFAEKTGGNRFVFLAYDNSLKEQAEQKVKTEIVFADTKKEYIEELIAYYTLQMFSDHVIISSLDIPEGRNGKNIIGINNITEEEAVAIGILGLRDIF